MIELRYKGGKLQYRSWHVRIDASGAITPTPLPIEWLPWADVEELLAPPARINFGLVSITELNDNEVLISSGRNGVPKQVAKKDIDELLKVGFFD